MSTENLFSKHPSALSDAERASMRAAAPEAFDEEPAVKAGEAGDAPGDEAQAAADAAAKAAADQTALDAAAAAEAEAAASAAATDEGAGKAKGDGVMIPKGRFDEVNNELKSVKGRLEQLEQQRLAALAPIATDRDFKAEKAALKAKYDDGDIELTDYLEQREAVVVEESKFAARADVALANAEAAKLNAQAAWDAKVRGWETQHAEFLANPVRRDAVAALFTRLGADPALNDEALIAAVEKHAFEAFNYSAPAAAAGAGAGKPPSPTAVRDAKDAAALSAAGAAPGALSAGAGDRGRAAGIDIKSLKQGEFAKLPKEQRAALLGGAEAL